jgi:hypothetical protein
MPDITAFPIPTITIPSFGGQGSYYFSQSSANAEGHNIFCDNFWKVGETLDDCRWEYWYRPELFEGSPYSGSYVLAGGEGGDHEVLSGLNVGTEWCSATGNFHATDGINYPNSWTGLDEFATSEFVHVSVGIRGSDIYVHIFGVLSNIVAMAHERIAVGSKLFLSGSDHNAASGYLFGARGYEQAGIMDAYRRNFITDHHFLPHKLNFDSTAYEKADFCMMTDYPSGALIDTSQGWETVTGQGRIQHHGYPNISAIKPPKAGGVFPIFVPGIVPEPPVAFKAVPSTPVGALVFDSFNRAPVVPSWHQSATGILPNTFKMGYAPSGSLGPLEWKGGGGWGIIDGRAYSTYQTLAHPYVETDRTNARLSVKRVPNTIQKTGLTARYVDDANCCYVRATPSIIEMFNVVGGVTTSTSWATDSAYTKIDLQVNGTTATVYKDDVSLGTFTVTANSSNNHGLFANTALDDIYRFDDFTMLPAA